MGSPMSVPKISPLFFLGMFLGTASLCPAADAPLIQATFSSVTGKVTLQGPNSKKKTTVHLNSTAREGDWVTTGKDSSATLVLFDGSQLQIGAQSSLVLSSLQKPSALDKVLKFRLWVGRILATVKKLTSAHSAFEISAGGVVCGVRGTVYSMLYQPEAQTLDLSVSEGTVFTQVNGGPATNITAGQSLHLTHVTNPANNGTGGSATNAVNGASEAVSAATAVTSVNNTANEAVSGTNAPNGGTTLTFTPASPLDNPALTGLDTTFQSGILVNGENGLTAANRHQAIVLQVPPAEAVP